MPNPLQVYQRLGEIERLLEVDRADDARQRLLQLSGEVPDLPAVESLRARVELAAERPAEAEEAARRYITLAPDDAQGYALLSVALLERNRTAEALEAIDRAVGLDPTHAHYRGRRAQLLLVTGDERGAEAAARAGLELDPDEELSRNILALALNYQGRRGEATATVGELLAHNPDNPIAHANVGHIALRDGRIAEARTHFVEALRLDPDNAFARSGLAEVIKATNPLYRGLLRFSVWMTDIGTNYRWGILIGLIVVVRFVPALLPAYLVLLLWTWFTGPLSNTFLLAHPTGRYLVEPEDRPYALAVAAAFAVALAALAGAFVTDRGALFATALACAFAAIPLNRLVDELRTPNVTRIAFASAAVFLGLGAWALALAVQDEEAGQVVGALVIVAVAYSWVGHRVGR